MKELTKRQKEILKIIIAFINEKGYAPSFREIGELDSESSLSTVKCHLTGLVKKGFLKIEPKISRSIKVLKEK